MLRVMGFSSVGNSKTVNEDSIFSKQYILDGLEMGAIAVADGMGGYDCGDVHSKLAIDTVKKSINASLAEPNKVQILLNQCFREIDQSIRNYNLEHSKLGGTTLTVALIANGRYLMKNIGDSRCYLIHENSIVKISEDHALFDDNGKKKSTLTRCLGMGTFQSPFSAEGILEKEDTLLICSDGFYNELSDDEILNITVGILESKIDIGKDVLSKLYQRNEKDNISTVIVQYC